MLLQTHKTSESICIGDEIEFMLVAICEKKVRFGFAAPVDASIQRRERLKPLPRGSHREEEIAQFSAVESDVIVGAYVLGPFHDASHGNDLHKYQTGRRRAS